MKGRKVIVEVSTDGAAWNRVANGDISPEQAAEVVRKLALA